MFITPFYSESKNTRTVGTTHARQVTQTTTADRRIASRQSQAGPQFLLVLYCSTHYVTIVESTQAQVLYGSFYL